MMDEAAPGAKVPATQMFDFLAHPEWLLIANLPPKGCKSGCLDSFMQWHLIDQTREEMHVLSLAGAESLVASCWTCLERQEYMIFSELRRVSWRQYVV